MAIMLQKVSTADSYIRNSRVPLDLLFLSGLGSDFVAFAFQYPPIVID